MSDLKRYVAKRKQSDKDFADGYDAGYQDFKIGEMLKQARLEAGLTQEEMAEKLHTKKSAISRIENHAQDIRLSTLQNFAQMMGKELKVKLV
ncbi:MAG: helix-turn-helix domain-containing protein [Campylobacterales bacterium]